MYKKWLRKGISCALLVSILAMEVSPGIVQATETKVDETIALELSEESTEKLEEVSETEVEVETEAENDAVSEEESDTAVEDTEVEDTEAESESEVSAEEEVETSVVEELTEDTEEQEELQNGLEEQEETEEQEIEEQEEQEEQQEEVIPLTADEVAEILAKNTTSNERKDYSSSNNSAHAYNPMEAIEKKEAEEEARKSAEYNENVVIYKMKSSSSRSASVVNSVLNELGITETEELFVIENTSGAKKASSYEIIYRGKLKENNVWDVVDELNKLEEVDYAEPEFIYHTTAIGTPDKTTDPDLSEQWYLNDLNTESVWENLSTEEIIPGQDTIVAVIDTGVDYEHEDLQSNMWVNTAELYGRPGVDDDGNGYVDDIYGVSTVGSTSYHNGNPMDDHGHGTHVAGIIGMTASNLLGGAGVSYGTKIMAIKAGQSTGSFASTDIAEAIRYAKQMGADVINMSFGGYGRSSLVEEALSEAFSSCVLVAAAGNDGIPTSDAPEDFPLKGDMYPAAYSYVLGVMATDSDRNLASFSNWDYQNNTNAEYELTAPGVQIYSTLPGNQYAKWSGTSMAAPMVSAAAAILRSKYEEKGKYNSRFIMGQLASATLSSTYYVDKLKEEHFYRALNIEHSLEKLPTPNLVVKNTYLFDSKEIDDNNDEDGIVDAGEIIDLGIVVRNQWGLAEKVTIHVDAISDGGVANPNIEFITDTIVLDSIGTFQERNNGFVYNNDYLVGVETPIRFKVKESTINDAQIQLNITITAENGFDEKDTQTYIAKDQITFMVQRGKVLKGVIDQDTTLTKENYWIIENSLRVMENATLTIEPGTQLQFWSTEAEGPYSTKAMVYIQVDGKLLANGTKEEPIEMFPSFAFQNYSVEILDSGARAETSLSYVNIINLGKTVVDEANHIKAVQNQDDLIVRYLSSGTISESTYAGYKKVKITEVANSIFKSFRVKSTTYPTVPFEVSANNTLFDSCGIEFAGKSSYVDCTFLGNKGETAGKYNSVSSIVDPGKIYGTSDKLNILTSYTSGDRKYALVNNYASWASGIGAYNEWEYLNRTFATIGGGIACVSSEEEAEIIPEVINKMYSELKFMYPISVTLGGYRHKEGKEIEWLDESNYQVKVNGSSDGFVYYYRGLDLKYFDVFGNKQSYVLLEFPSTVTDAQIKSLSYKNFWEVVPKEETGFYNNAILNRLLDTNVGNWLKVTTQKSYPTSFIAKENYWGTTNEKLIEKQSNDFDTYIALADIVQSPWLATSASSTYPHVTEVYLTDLEGNRLKTAGYQQVQVHVTFNRDMDPSNQPMVSFGPAEPYTDYVVEGEFKTPTHWVGTTTISNVLNAGQQYFRVRGGSAAEDGWLETGTDYLRFTFEVNGTNAESLTLQGTGGENKVELYWTQDEYPTLAGYNVYRSTSENGTYTKINTRLIPSTVRSYIDKNVESGKTYYYYFTVMDTDMTESRPSNKVGLAPKDNVKPTLQHTRVTRATYGEAIAFNAVASDNMKVEYVRAIYRTKGADDWKRLDLTNTSGNNYYGVIKASEVSKEGMEYYLEVSDGTNLTRQGSATTPLQIEIDAKVVIYSVTPAVVDIEGGSTAVVTGVNFTDTMTLKVNGEIVPHTYVSEKRLEFIIPKGQLGRVDIQLVEKEGTVTTFSNAITYEDTTSEIQINESKVVDDVIKLPIVVTSRGQIKAVDLTLKVDRSIFSAAKFEKAETTSNALTELNYSYNGTIKLSIASSASMKTGQTIGYLVLTPKSVTTAITTSIQISSGELNGVSANSLIDCNVTLLPNFSIRGTVRYYSSNEPLEGVTIETNVGTPNVTSAVGTYALTGITSNKVIVTPVYYGHTNGAISAQDAAMVLKVIVEAETISSNQMYAADVNGDGQVNAMDASYILQKAVGIIEGNYPGSNAEWIFTPQSKTLNLTGDVSGVNFTGILLGDVTGDWQVAEDNLE